MEGVTSRGRPVWKHKSHYNRIFFSGNKHWLCGDDYEETSGWIESKDIVEEGVIPHTIWRISDGEKFIDDSTLIVEGLMTLKNPYALFKIRRICISHC